MEVKAIINSRPLLYITPTDMEESLTPSHLLTNRRIREAVVKIFAKNRQATLLRRPLQLLYPLEVHSNDGKNDGKQDTQIKETLDNSYNDTKILKESTT